MSEVHAKIIEWIKAGEKPEDVAKSFCVARSKVSRTITLHKGTGGVKKCRRGRQTQTARTEDKIREVQDAIKANPSVSGRKLTRDHGVAWLR